MAGASSRTRAWPVGAVIFSLVLAAGFVAYALNIYAQARGATDWMMIAPAAAIGAVALLVSILEDIRAGSSLQEPAEGAAAGAESAGQTFRTVLFMALLCLYVAAVPFAGFDIASFVFLALALLVQGERRILVCVGFALLVTLPVVWLFVDVLHVALPTFLL